MASESQLNPVLHALGLKADAVRRDRFRGMIGEVLQQTGSIASTVRALQSSKAVMQKLDKDLTDIVSFETKER